MNHTSNQQYIQFLNIDKIVYIQCRSNNNLCYNHNDVLFDKQGSYINHLEQNIVIENVNFFMFILKKQPIELRTTFYKRF